jgi:hypothetical protein
MFRSLAGTGMAFMLLTGCFSRVHLRGIFPLFRPERLQTEIQMPRVLFQPLERNRRKEFAHAVRSDQHESWRTVLFAEHREHKKRFPEHRARILRPRLPPEPENMPEPLHVLFAPDFFAFGADFSGKTLHGLYVSHVDVKNRLTETGPVSLRFSELKFRFVFAGAALCLFVHDFIPGPCRRKALNFYVLGNFIP